VVRELAAPPVARAGFDDTDRLGVTTLRILAADAVEQAKSGHPGLPMGAADMAYVLWTRFLHHSPANPGWADRDRFVLSAGHGSMLLYALLHLTGYDLPMDELRRFRQWGSRTPGHPEFGLTPGVETTTGPLGQGFATAVGMALAEAHLAARFNHPGHAVVDHWTYVIASDGDLMEGISHEAASLAGHWGLGKLVVLYDANGISIDGPTALALSDDAGLRFTAYGWHVLEIDGHDLEAVDQALRAARAASDRPSLVVARTHIGFGSPNRQDTAKAHGEPLGEDEVRLTKRRLGWPVESAFHVPDSVLDRFRRAVSAGRAWEIAWAERVAACASEYPGEAAALQRILAGTLPEGWEQDLPAFAPGGTMATRAASGKVLEALVPRIDVLVGGSGDLTPSNNTLVAGQGAVARGHFAGRYIHFGVREHAMGAVLNGLALHGLRPYGGTFLIFSDYMRPAIRLAALMHQPVVFVFTHDSIGLGEDGPTHQPVEHLWSLRAIPNLVVIRPADASEVAIAWRVALARRGGPTALVLTRQALPVLDRERLAPADALESGGYVLAETPIGTLDVVLIATGSEVHLALDARGRLAEAGVGARVVNLPSTELFEMQPEAYRARVLPPGVKARVAIEAGATLGWDRYVGPGGVVIGLDRFGASAPGAVVYRELGFTSAAVAAAALKLLRAPDTGETRPGV
jgi:transketolase